MVISHSTERDRRSLGNICCDKRIQTQSLCPCTWPRLTILFKLCCFQTIQSDVLVWETRYTVRLSDNDYFIGFICSNYGKKCWWRLVYYIVASSSSLYTSQCSSHSERAWLVSTRTQCRRCVKLSLQCFPPVKFKLNFAINSEELRGATPDSNPRHSV